MVDGGVGGEQQLHAVAVAFVAGGVQRREAVAVCVVDGGVGGEQHLHAVAFAFLAGGDQRCRRDVHRNLF